MALKAINSSTKIVYAFDGVEALEKLRNGELESVDFIFLDLNMPRMNGKQFLAEIKKDPVLKNIPVIIYSTSSDSHDREEAERLGAKAFLTKPPYFSQLTQLLQDFFSRQTPK